MTKRMSDAEFQEKYDNMLVADLRKGMRGDTPESAMAAAAIRIEELLRRLSFYENGGLQHSLTPVTGFHREGANYLWYGEAVLQADAPIKAGAKLMLFREPGQKVMVRPQEEFFADDGLEHRTVAAVLGQ